MAGCEESFGFYFIFVLLTYLLWMDLSFFDELSVYGSSYNATTASKMMFPLKSVKLRMTEHIDHYINLPLMEVSNEKLGISAIPGVTPNVISGFHFFCAVIACKLIVSDRLTIRRIGCALYEFRNQLDLLDGVVYRAQSHKKQFVSGWGSSGYLVDAAMDFAGGFMLGFSLCVFLQRYPPLKRVREKKDIEAGKGLITDYYSGKHEKTSYSFVHVDRRTINFVAIMAVIQTVARSGFWDYYVRSYHELLEVPSTVYSKDLQAEVLNYRSTWVVMWLWKISSADAFFEFTILAILFDKIWVWLRSIFYIGFFQIAAVLVLSQLHLMEVKRYMNGG